MLQRYGIGITVVLGLVLVPTLAGAQAIGGSVTDTTGGVLPGVTVEVRSPALIEQVRTVVSDASGQYLIVQLESGTYSVTFTLAGFSTFVREGIELAGTGTANVDGEMQVGSVEETITVSGQSPVIDVQNVTQQAVMTRDIIDSIPSGRQFSNLAVLTPGMRSGTVRASIKQDVGGQSGQIHMALGIHGGDTDDQHLTVDGISTASWLQEDASATWFTDGNFEEYTIDHSANAAEIETGGVRINMIPREGSNTFSSRSFFNVSHPSMQRDNLTDKVKQTGLVDANRVKDLWQVNPSVGGPIVRDKLWFFGSFSRQVANSYVAGTYEDTDNFDHVFTPDTSRQAVDDQNVTDYAFRITYQPTPRNKITAYHDQNFVCHCHFLVGTGAISIPVQPSASVFYNSHNVITQVGWVSPVSSRVLLEATLGLVPHWTTWRDQPEMQANPQVGVLEVGGGLSSFGSFSAWYTRSEMDVYETNNTARASVSYVTGSHAAKVGVTLNFGKAVRDRRNNSAGDYTIMTRFGRPLFVTFNGNPLQSHEVLNPNMGIYAQDQWTLDRLTLNLGVRFDLFRTGYADHNNPPTPNVPVARIFDGATAVSWQDLQPRIGLAYDLFGTGKTALKVTANRYGDREGMGHAASLNPADNNNTSGRRYWVDYTGDFIPNCDPLNPMPNGECFTPGNFDFGKSVINTFYDEDWAFGWGNRYSNWEFSGSLQHELVAGLSMNVAYFRRIFTNFNVLDNRAIETSDYDPYCVMVPADTRLGAASGQQLCGLYDLTASKVGLVDEIRTSSDNFGKQTRHWNGVDVTLNARMDNGLVLQGGWSAGRTTSDFCDLASKLDNPSSLYCHTETPFVTDVKLLGAYTLPGDVQFAATFQSIQGPSVLAEVNYSVAEIAASLGRAPNEAGSVDVQVIAPGSMYGPRLHQLDMRVTKILTFGGTRVQAMFDLYNALNLNTTLILNDEYGAAGFGATSEWGRPGAILPGMLAKFGFQVDF